MANMARVNSFGRQVHGHYVESYALDDLGDTDPQAIEWRIEELRDKANEMRFTSIFDAIVVIAQSSKPQIRREFATFVKEGGLHDLFSLSHRAGYFKSSLQNESPFTESLLRGDTSTDSSNLVETEDTSVFVSDSEPLGQGYPQLSNIVVDTAIAIIKKEWISLCQHSSMKKPMREFDDSYIESFSFHNIYHQMQSLSPSLFRVLEALIPSKQDANLDTSQPGKTKEQKHQRRRKRQIVIAVSILGNLSNKQFNVVQGFLGYYLYACRVSSRVFPIFNHLGITPSIDGVRRALKSHADARRELLKSLGATGKAFQISFDNAALQYNVRYERLNNRGGFKVDTVGFVALPHEDNEMEEFKRLDADYKRVASLSVIDFIPSEDDSKYLREASRSMLFDVIKRFCQSNDLSVPNLTFSMPSIDPLDPKKSAKILTLPAYDKDEGKINDIIDIHYSIKNDIGLSGEQVETNLQLFKGDYMTIHNSR
jgi:hypothetical protein